MKNFKQIAEDCLAGKLSGTFILRNSGSWKSNTLSRYSIDGKIIPDHYVIGKGIIIDSNGLNMEIKERVQHFIPDIKKEQITIDIPEGKVPVMEQTANGIVITWKEKELTYDDVSEKLSNDRKYIGSFGYTAMSPNLDTDAFYKKVEVLRKLTNIRNYFGLDPHRVSDWVICISTDGTYYARATRQPLCYEIAFSKQEHAEQAIKMLGDELKYLFEPW
jgi:hypothetical protein